MKSSAKKVELASVDDLFSTEESRADAQREKVLEIPLSELHPFKDHPFKVKDDDAMMETADSIRQYADMKSLMETTDEWLRHRIRAVYWKQWKRVRTRYKMLRALHLPEWKVHEMANCRKGTWRAAEMLNSVLTKTIIVDRLGYPPMTAHYLKVRVNY